MLVLAENSSHLLPTQNPRNKSSLVLSQGDSETCTHPSLERRGPSNAGVNFSENTINFFQSCVGGGERYIYLITQEWGGLNLNAPSSLKGTEPVSQILRRWNRTRCVVGERERKAKEKEEKKG